MLKYLFFRLAFSLNETKSENDELKETISKLQNSEVVRVETETSFKSNETETRFNFNETETLLQRIPRNFLSSSPEIVAFDAYRNKPFHTAQVTFHPLLLLMLIIL